MVRFQHKSVSLLAAICVFGSWVGATASAATFTDEETSLQFDYPDDWRLSGEVSVSIFSPNSWGGCSLEWKKETAFNLEIFEESVERSTELAHNVVRNFDSDDTEINGIEVYWYRYEYEGLGPEEWADKGLWGPDINGVRFEMVGNINMPPDGITPHYGFRFSCSSLHPEEYDGDIFDLFEEILFSIRLSD